MNHPFALSLDDLEVIEIDFQEPLTDEETARLGGGKHNIQCISAPCPGSEGGGNVWPPIIKEPPYPTPPVATTKALGEEGGQVTTLALGEEGGYY
jgi:hypothetical protein